jgi:Cu(I)/Ag(I) efflux system membrane protein CusA/SilA
MIDAIIRGSINNRALVLLASFAIVLIGAYSLARTPVDAIPDLSDVQVIIKTQYPGQAPSVVQDQVTYPITTAMLSVPGAVTVRGYSFFGDSFVYVIFDEDTDLYWARSRVLEYLSQVAPTLPETAKPQLGPDATGVGWVYLYALIDKTGQHDLSELRSLQDWFLKFELQSIKGVSEVATIGGMVRQYQVRVHPDKLRAFNIPLSHIQNAILRGNQEVGASVVEMAEAEYMVRATGYIKSVDDLGNVPLGLNSNGTPLLLKDVADISTGPQMRRGLAELNGEGETVGGVIVMRYGENAAATIKAVKARLEVLKKSLPDGVELISVYDRSSLIDRAIDHLWTTLALELAIVGFICLIFLSHVRSALVAAISLPVGVLVAFIIMHWQGLNANIMSLGGIAIAIGTMIDGAIVLVENLHRHMEKTPATAENRWQLITTATLEVAPALFFSLLIITVSFLPVFTLQAQEGRLFAPLAYTKTYTMAAAAFLTITVMPVLLGYFVRGRIRPAEKNPINRLLLRLYRPSLTFLLRHPRKTLTLVFVATIGGLMPLSQLGSEFMPPLDEGDLMYMPTTYPGISIGKARQLLQQTDKLISTLPEVQSVFGKVGRAETATDPAPLTMIETFIALKPRDQWRPGVTVDSLKRELDQLVRFPGVTNAWVMPIKTRIDMLATGIKTPVGIKIAGPSLDEIEAIGKRLETLLQDVPGTTSVYAERVTGGRYLKVDIQREKAARYGLNIADIQLVVATAIGGTNVSQSVEGQERYPINIRYPQAYRDSPEQLELLPIITPDGKRIPLGDVANIFIEDGPPGIKSENARLNGWVYIDIDGVDVGSYVKEAQSIVAEQLDLPPRYSITWAGQYEYMERASERLRLIVPITLLLIIFLLYLHFRRFGEIALIMLTLPIAAVGAVWMLYLQDFYLSVAVGVGLIALCGVAVETAVIMLAYLHQSSHVGDGPTPFDDDLLRQAILTGASRRVRPVMMTALATIGGLLPVILGEGTGSEVMTRIATPMFGGMITAVLLTLYVIPVSYFQLEKFRARRLHNQAPAQKSNAVT